MTNDPSNLHLWQGQPAPAIPLYLTIENGMHHDDDTREHEVHLSVIGAAEETLTVAVVQSDAYKDPIVLRYEHLGAAKIPQVLLDEVILRAFKALAYHMLKADGDGAEMWVSNAVAWLGRRKMGDAGLAAVAAALGPSATPGCSVPDAVCVRID